MSQGSNKREVEKRWRAGVGREREKREDLEKRLVFRNKLNERERKRKGGERESERGGGVERKEKESLVKEKEQRGEERTRLQDG